jgi:hypothetical protein
VAFCARIFGQPSHAGQHALRRWVQVCYLPPTFARGPPFTWARCLQVWPRRRSRRFHQPHPRARPRWNPGQKTRDQSSLRRIVKLSDSGLTRAFAGSDVHEVAADVLSSSRCAIQVELYGHLMEQIFCSLFCVQWSHHGSYRSRGRRLQRL